MNMTRGVHKGEPLEGIPTDYLEWAARTWRGCDELIVEIENVLKMRRGEGVVRNGGAE